MVEESRPGVVKIKMGSKPATNVHEGGHAEADMPDNPDQPTADVPPVPMDKQAVPSQAEAAYVRPQPRLNVLENCSTCAFSTWDPKGERDMYSCRNQHSKYFEHSFCKGATYAKDTDKCWYPRGVYTVGEYLKGDPK